MTEWIDHDGKFIPLHAPLSANVLVRFRDGEETTVPERVMHWCAGSSNWSWNRRLPGDSEIVAYKVVL